MPIGGVTSRNASTSTFPLEAQLFYGLNTSSEAIRLGKFNEAPLLTMLSMGLGLPTRTVDQKEFKVLLEYEDITEVLIEGYSAGDAAITTATTTFQITDIAGTITNANLLIQAEDVLWIPATQTNQTTAVGTVGESGELIRVMSVDSAGAYFTAEREIGGAATTTVGVAAGSGNYLRAFIQGHLHGETSRARSVINHPFKTQLQYIQKYQEPYEASLDAMATAMAGGDPMTTEQRKKLSKIMREIEYSFISGKKTMVNSSTEGTKLLSRGILPFILGDSTTSEVYTAASDLVTGTGAQRVWKVGDKDNFTVNNWLTFIERIYSEGSDRKVMLCGPGFHTMFLQTMASYLSLDFESTTADRLGMKLTSWQHGGSEPLIIQKHGLMKGPLNQDAIVVDLGHVRKAVFGNGDLRIWKGNGGAGLQENDVETIKHAWQAKTALDITSELAHAWVNGVVNTDATYGGPDRTVGTNTTVNV